jgi:hypothetical protein
MERFDEVRRASREAEITVESVLASLSSDAQERYEEAASLDNASV